MKLTLNDLVDLDVAVRCRKDSSEDSGDQPDYKKWSRLHEKLADEIYTRTICYRENWTDRKGEQA
jgi:hypothetical protein